MIYILGFFTFTCTIEKAQYVDNFTGFSIAIFSNIVFQTSYEKCFIVKENVFDKVELYINKLLRF